LQLRSDSVGFDGRVAGAPDQEQVEVMTSTIDRPWWRGLTRWVAVVLAFLLGAAGLTYAVFWRW